MTAITLTANAKLTTSLAVVGRRPDGYHLLDAEMVSLDLADTLQVEEGLDGFEVHDEVAWTGLPGSVSGAEEVLSPTAPGANLVERALRRCGVRARCILEKRIPTGAGLGGGSSDAAAILRWRGLRDPAVAVELGADVPFCVTGGAARVRGIGEIVEPVELPAPDTAFLLVTPRMHVSTPVVYAAYDEAAGGRVAPGAGREDRNANDLEEAALLVYPGLRWWRDLLGASAGVRPRLAGSGGTWFVEGAPTAMAELAGQLRGEVLCGRESAMVTIARRAVVQPSM